jgi:hypothetical protein
MAQLDQAIALNILLMLVARSSRAMTLECVNLSTVWYESVIRAFRLVGVKLSRSTTIFHVAPHDVWAHRAWRV